MQEFNYRRAFGLTQAELKREPLKSYLINSFILGIYAKLEKEEVEKLNKAGGAK